MAKTKVLICGVTGFIGRHMADRFTSKSGLEVVGTYFKTTPDEALKANKNISLVRADLTQKDTVNELVKGVDVVIQCAAVTTGAKDVVTRPYVHVTDNAVMNSLLFRACFEAQVKQVVFFSCTTMYPEKPYPVKEEDFDHKIIDKYFGVGWTKVYIEKMCEFYSRISKTKYMAIRHSNIYGPHDKFDLERSHVFGATCTKVMTAQGGKFVVWGDGSDERDLLYISDLVDFVEAAVEKQKDAFDLVNLSYGKSVSVKELVQKIIDISGKTVEMEFDLSKPSINFKLAVDSTRARTRYGWTPKVSLEDGIKKTLAWYRENVYETIARQLEKTAA